ncbi:MAG: DNA polymerase III subunit gamma/tau [Planctomycetota bacterium]|nr:DNA polymerase III subunit gamma/tau [Planctomycetota bacterium]
MAAASNEDRPAGSSGDYQVVARRFRPQTFDELVGQEEVLQSLRRALEQGRVPHAFLFTGSRGVGKTTSARILARCLNCEQGPTPTPCGECESCVSILDGSNPDVIEMDAASNNGVGDIRQLRESVAFATMQSRYRVVILDEAHMLSASAWNAFLKTLEEPPPGVIFVMATTERHKVPETIVSRCQVLPFRRVGETDLIKRLSMIAEKEGVAIAADVLEEIAMSVRGGVRDAETALERILPIVRELGDEFDLEAYRGLTARVGLDAVVEVVHALLQGDAKRGLEFARAMQEQGFDEREALGEITSMLRNLLLMKIDGEDTGLVALTGALRDRVKEIAGGVDMARLDAMIGAGILGRERLRRLEDRGVVFEVALVRMAQAGALPTLSDLLAEVRAGGGGSFAAAAQAPAVAAPSRSAPPRPTAASPSPPTPTRPATPVAGSDELKARALARLSDRKLLQATLELCRFAGPDQNGRVSVTLETERKMYIDRIKSPVIEQELKQVIQEVAARDVTVELAVASSGDAASGAAATDGARKAPAKDAQPGPKAKQLLKKFGGRVVQVNPKDRVKEPPKRSSAEHDLGEEMLDPGPPPQD